MKTTHLLALLLLLNTWKSSAQNPPAAANRQHVIELKWDQYSRSNPAIIAHKQTIAQLTPLKKKLEAQIGLLNGVLLAKNYKDPQAEQQLQQTRKQVTSVITRISESEQSIRQIKAQYLLSIAASLPP